MTIRNRSLPLCKNLSLFRRPGCPIPRILWLCPAFLLLVVSGVPHSLKNYFRYAERHQVTPVLPLSFKLSKIIIPDFQCFASFFNDFNALTLRRCFGQLLDGWGEMVDLAEERHGGDGYDLNNDRQKAFNAV